MDVKRAFWSGDIEEMYIKLPEHEQQKGGDVGNLIPVSVRNKIHTHRAKGRSEQHGNMSPVPTVTCTKTRRVARTQTHATPHHDKHTVISPQSDGVPFL